MLYTTNCNLNRIITPTLSHMEVGDDMSYVTQTATNVPPGCREWFIFFISLFSYKQSVDSHACGVEIPLNSVGGPIF